MHILKTMATHGLNFWIYYRQFNKMVGIWSFFLTKRQVIPHRYIALVYPHSNLYLQHIIKVSFNSVDIQQEIDEDTGLCVLGPSPEVSTLLKLVATMS